MKGNQNHTWMYIIFSMPCMAKFDRSVFWLENLMRVTYGSWCTLINGPFKKLWAGNHVIICILLALSRHFDYHSRIRTKIHSCKKKIEMLSWELFAIDLHLYDFYELNCGLILLFNLLFSFEWRFCVCIMNLYFYYIQDIQHQYVCQKHLELLTITSRTYNLIPMTPRQVPDTEVWLKIDPL